MPKVVAGLGNPGPKYETTRHNVGFLALDRLIDDWQARGPVKAYEGEIWEASVAGEKVYLVKPQTYMNNSGRCIAPLANFYKCKPEDIVVLYDELDLKPASIRIKTGGGSGGHNGIKSIDASLGLANTGYHRVRIGIGHPRALNLQLQPVDYVLQQFSDGELENLDGLFGNVEKAVKRILDGDVRGAMNEFNTDKSVKQE
jgi:peptidyl-tRNA hydrolase, PTH1 family